MKRTKKDFTKFTKRNVHKRRSKDAAVRELLSAARSAGADVSNVKIRDSLDRGRGGRLSENVRRDERKERGIFSSSKSGFGFVSLESGGRDVFIPADRTGGALDGDFVEVVYHKYETRMGEERTEGRVARIIEVGRKTVIGTVSEEWARHGKRTYRYATLIPDDSRIGLRPVIREMAGADFGDKVEARLLRDGSSHPECNVVRVFGATDTKEANYEAILADCEIITDFTPEELEEAERVAAEPLTDDGRVRRTGDIIFTIDGAGAKDLDDAISLRKLPGGKFRLGVHIADVSHYVRERSALERCAMARGTSVYFTDKVVPMLPPVLSNGACSLNAGEEKYALSAIMDIDSDGTILKTAIEESIIVSRVRGVYSEVNAILGGTADAGLRRKYASVLPTLGKMTELYEILEKKSRGRGAVDFEGAEPVIELDELGVPVDIRRAERGVSERMIEQFMLAANEGVATLLTEKHIPCVYRIHEAPPPDKLEAFIAYAHSLGFDTSVISEREVSAASFSRLLAAADERGLSAPVSYTMLRSMSKAKYSDERSGHFGLALDTYCHFTSPIRRLSDLATHRIIKRALLGDKRPESYGGLARRAAAAATEGELRAIGAERRIENLYKTIYMSARLGEEFDARISSVTPYGLFCELENTCEGLIPVSEMRGVFTFDEKTLTLRSRERIYRLAEPVKIRVEEADIIRGKLRFSLVEN